MFETPEVLLQHGRKVYVPSGRVDWPRFIFYVSTACVISVMLGGLLYLALLCGLYFILITPFLLGLALGQIANQLIQSSHCRNTVLSLTTGCFLGMVMFLSHYQAQVVHHGGFDGLFQIEALPDVIWHRLETDSDGPEPGQGAVAADATQDLFKNCFLALADFLACVLVVGGLACQSSLSVYDESQHRWMTQKTLLFASGSGVPIVSGLFTNQLGTALAAAQVYIPDNSDAEDPVDVNHCMLIIDYSRGQEDSHPTAAFLSVREIPCNQLLLRCELTPEECTEIAPFVTPEIKDAG